jgi:hypothetical protein
VIEDKEYLSLNLRLAYYVTRALIKDQTNAEGVDITID